MMTGMAIQVPINLATEPFRRDRPMLVASAAVGLLLVILLGVEVKTIVSERHDGADIHVTINRLNTQLRGIAAQQAKLNALLGRPENAEVLDRSLFLNSMIDRKAISWTRFFADLEKVVPYNVRLVSVRLPEVDSENRVLLDMVVGAQGNASHRGIVAPSGGLSAVWPGQLSERHAAFANRSFLSFARDCFLCPETLTGTSGLPTTLPH